MSDAASKFQSATPVFVVTDVVKSAEFYRDRLGFHFNRYWGDPPCFVIVLRDRAELFLTQAKDGGKACPNSKLAGGEAWDAYFNVSDIEALQREFTARGVKILSPPNRTVYNMRELELEDPDGYRLCFAQDCS